MDLIGPVALAFVAGVVSITSPCCLPLLPGYVSYVSAVSGDDPECRASRRRVLGAAVLFVVGFSIVFTLLGATATTIGGLVLANRLILERVAGVFVIVMGVVTIGILRVPFLERQYRFDLSRVRPGPGGAVPLGMAFAVGWTPCIGPVLAAVLAAAASTATPLTGAILLWAYSLGLGVPFVLLAAGHGWANKSFSWLRRHVRVIEIGGGALLMLMGVLMITGQWTRLFAPLIAWFTRNNWPPI